MNRSVLVLVTLLVMAAIAGGYSARKWIVPSELTTELNPSATLTPVAIPEVAPGEGANEEIVKAIPLRVDSFKPIVSRSGQKVHPVDVLMQRALAGSAMVLANLLRISKVSIEGNYYVDDSEVADLAGVARSPWIWESTFTKIQENLTSSPWIRGSQLSWRLFPLSLEIRVTEARPWLVAELGNDSWLISRQGELLEPLRTIKDTQLILDTVGLPRLDGLLRQGDSSEAVTPINSRLAKAVSILAFYQIAADFPFAVDRFTYLDDAGILITPAQPMRYPAVVVEAQSFGDANTAIAKLKVVLHDIEKRNERAARIDLRFNGQAVVKLVEDQNPLVQAKSNSSSSTVSRGPRRGLK